MHCELLSCSFRKVVSDEHFVRMGSVNLVVVVESVRSIVDHKSGDLNELHIPSLVAVGAALGEPKSVCSMTIRQSTHVLLV